MNPIKYILSRALVVFAALIVGNTAQAEIHTVPFVDVTQYIGVWYQIAHKPLFFEGGNCPCAQQTLTTTPDPKVVHVFNSCGLTGQKQTISGEATDQDSTNSKFSVSFQGVPFSGTYWIIGLDPQYRFAVVSDRWSYSLYILAKTPTLSDELYQQAVALAAQQVDTSPLVMTDQKNCTY